MWRIIESKEVDKICRKLPPGILEKYDIWKDLVRVNGPESLQGYPGLRNEKLKGGREGQWSSRLNLQYRVIYTVHRDVVTVHVLEITPHKY